MDLIVSNSNDIFFVNKNENKNENSRSSISHHLAVSIKIINFLIIRCHV